MFGSSRSSNWHLPVVAVLSAPGCVDPSELRCARPSSRSARPTPRVRFRSPRRAGEPTPEPGAYHGLKADGFVPLSGRRYASSSATHPGARTGLVCGSLRPFSEQNPRWADNTGRDVGRGASRYARAGFNGRRSKGPEKDCIGAPGPLHRHRPQGTFRGDRRSLRIDCFDPTVCQSRRKQA